MKYKIFVLFHARKNLKISEREKGCIYNDFRDFKMQGLRESGTRSRTQEIRKQERVCVAQEIRKQERVRVLRRSGSRNAFA